MAAPLPAAVDDASCWRWPSSACCYALAQLLEASRTSRVLEAIDLLLGRAGCWRSITKIVAAADPLAHLPRVGGRVPPRRRGRCRPSRCRCRCSRRAPRRGAAPARCSRAASGVHASRSSRCRRRPGVHGADRMPRGAAMSELVFIEQEPTQGTEHAVEPGTTIGREGCDITLSDPDVSRRHAAIQIVRERAVDRGPRLDQRHLRERRAHQGARRFSDGDEVQIGATVWRLRAPAGATRARRRPTGARPGQARLRPPHAPAPSPRRAAEPPTPPAPHRSRPPRARSRAPAPASRARSRAGLPRRPSPAPAPAAAGRAGATSRCRTSRLRDPAGGPGRRAHRLHARAQAGRRAPPRPAAARRSSPRSSSPPRPRACSLYYITEPFK